VGAFVGRLVTELRGDDAGAFVGAFVGVFVLRAGDVGAFVGRLVAGSCVGIDTDGENVAVGDSDFFIVGFL
jgi:hypothetical protein